MPHSLLRRLTLPVLAVCAIVTGVVGLPSGTAWAHNTLLSSDPADGTELTAAPTQITWRFNKAVPLETMTVTLTDATGTRRELSGSTHGVAGDTEVVTPLPSLLSGPISVRWRLVGPDGHTITGRVAFTVAATATTTVPGVAASPLPPTATAPSDDTAVDRGDDSYSTSSVARWVLRYASYLAIMAIVGVLLMAALVWPGVGDRPVVRRILATSLFATTALAFVQLLVVASDVSGEAPWSSFGSLDAATATDAGLAFAIRIALALSMWLVVFRVEISHREVYWSAVSIPAVGLLATWALAGHAGSMRWPELGVITDVAHHAAAAVWIAGLAVVGWIVIPSTPPRVLVPTLRRFSRVAAISVGVLVTTGLVQTVRLVGGPLDLLDADHGRYLGVKLVVLGVMLGLANTNRQRLRRRLADPAGVGRHTHALRQAVVAEFAIGLVIVAITAAMVVSPPSSARSAPGASTERIDTHILHDVVILSERPS